MLFLRKTSAQLQKDANYEMEMLYNLNDLEKSNLSIFLGLNIWDTSNISLISFQGFTNRLSVIVA